MNNVMVMLHPRERELGDKSFYILQLVTAIIELNVLFLQ